MNGVDGGASAPDQREAIWLDCDPGHDDALAILLALYAPDTNITGGQQPHGDVRTSSALHVLGISTTHGNATGRDTFVNAARLLAAFHIATEEVSLWRGSDVPLVRPGRIDVDIHGGDGLGGVEALPDHSDPLFRSHVHNANGGQWQKASSASSLAVPDADVLGLVTHQIATLHSRAQNGLAPMSIVATGPLTNVAMLIKLCPPPLLQKTVKQIVLMGGAAGVPGNRGLLAEYNILVDPEAAAIVFEADVPVVMAGLNVTHDAIFTRALQEKLTNGTRGDRPLRRLVSSAMTFFAGTYRDVFGFKEGPPVHDLLAIAWVLDPSLFDVIDKEDRARSKTPQRYKVIIDTRDGPTCGATIVDFFHQTQTEESKGWGRGGRNAIVLEHIDTTRLWPLLFAAIEQAEARVA